MTKKYVFLILIYFFYGFFYSDLLYQLDGRLPYEYHKVEDISLEDFELIENFNPALPTQHIALYEKRANFGFSVFGDRYHWRELISTEYNAKSEWDGKSWEIPVYRVIDGVEQPVQYATDQRWIYAFEWIKENTEKNALIISWWDYGPYIKLFSGRDTIFSGYPEDRLNHSSYFVEMSFKYDPNIMDYEMEWYENTMGIERVEKVEDVAKMFTSSETEFEKFNENYNPEGKPIYVLISKEEFGKSGAINYHAKDNLTIANFAVPKSPDAERQITEIINKNQINSYLVMDYGSDYLVWVLVQIDKNGNYHPEWGYKMLAKLLPFNTGFGKGMTHFEPVYNNTYVYIYKYLD